MTWSYTEALSYLRSLGLFGMRFGLNRMKMLLEALGNPQLEFEAIHVVGTNGKTSTTWMTAALLERRGVATGAYISPHLKEYTERIRIRGNDISQADFAAAVQRSAAAVSEIGYEPGSEDPVTQFELLTATAFAEFARAGIDVAVVEAGLGGRLDATNVLDAPTVILTNVGLEHTQWLGETLGEIAREKAAVAHHATQIVVPELPGEVMEEVRLVRDRGQKGGAPCDLKVVDGDYISALPSQFQGFQRRNYALARATVESLSSRWGGVVEGEGRVEDEVPSEVPGRAQVVSRSPLTVVDGAHNPDGMSALLEAFPEVFGNLRPVAVVSILDDKDAEGMLPELLKHCTAAVFTRSNHPRARDPEELSDIALAAGFTEVTVESEVDKALATARTWAGADGAVLVVGSLYLVGQVLALSE